MQARGCKLNRASLAAADPEAALGAKHSRIIETPAAACLLCCFIIRGACTVHCGILQAAVELSKQLQQRIKQRGCREEFVANTEMLEQGKVGCFLGKSAFFVGKHFEKSVCAQHRDAGAGQGGLNPTLAFGKEGAHARSGTCCLFPHVCTPHSSACSLCLTRVYISSLRFIICRWSSCPRRPCLPRSWSGSAWRQRRLPSPRGERSPTQHRHDACADHGSRLASTAQMQLAVLQQLAGAPATFSA